MNARIWRRKELAATIVMVLTLLLGVYAFNEWFGRSEKRLFENEVVVKNHYENLSSPWYQRLSDFVGRWFGLKARNTAGNVDYISDLDCPLGMKIRPTPSATVVFELVRVDQARQEGIFKVVFNEEPREFEGPVRVGQLFEFCPRLAHIGVSLRELKGTNAIISVPGLVSH